MYACMHACNDIDCYFFFPKKFGLAISFSSFSSSCVELGLVYQYGWIDKFFYCISLTLTHFIGVRISFIL